MENLNLSKEEIAIIKERRANDLTLKKNEAIAKAKETISEYIAESNRKADEYKKHLDMLNEASMSKGCGEILFELVTEVINDEEVPYFYGEGLDMTKLKPIKYSTTRCSIKYKGETVKHQFMYIDEDGDKMNYYGEDPVGKGAFRVDATYSVEVYEHTTGYGFSQKNHGFKMKIDGLVYCSNERRDVGKKLTNPKTVVAKIKEDIQLRKRLIESDENSRSLKSRAISMVKLEFPNADVSEYNNNITVTFENGSSVEMRYYDEGEEGINLVTSRVTAPSKMNPIELGNNLKKM